MPDLAFCSAGTHAESSKQVDDDDEKCKDGNPDSNVDAAISIPKLQCKRSGSELSESNCQSRTPRIYIGLEVPRGVRRQPIGRPVDITARVSLFVNQKDDRSQPT